jgi:hypothetical protein
VDESATGSLNIFEKGSPGGIPFRFTRIRLVHLRMPSIDQGVQAFAWAVFYFLLLWVGMLAVGVSNATAFILSLLAGGAIFLFVRLRGDEAPGA